MNIPHTQDDINNILNGFEKIEYKNSLDPKLHERIKNDLINIKRYTNQIRPPQHIRNIPTNTVRKNQLQMMLFK